MIPLVARLFDISGWASDTLVPSPGWSKGNKPTKMSKTSQSHQSKRLSIFSLALLVLFVTGCSHLKIRDRWFDSDQVAKVPSEILPIWTDTVLHKPGHPGVRGFGGRVYFYEAGKPDPVQVNGNLVVYAFDANENDPESVKPRKKFVITPEQLCNHFSKSSLGNSYSIWLPWDKVGGPSQTVSLVARFDGVAGGTVMSKPSTKLLPGIDVEAAPVDRMRSASGVQLTSLEQDVVIESNPSTPRMDTTSIDLPPSFQRRLFSQLPSNWKASSAANAAIRAADNSAQLGGTYNQPVSNIPSSRQQPTQFRARTTRVPETDYDSFANSNAGEQIEAEQHREQVENDAQGKQIESAQYPVTITPELPLSDQGQSNGRNALLNARRFPGHNSPRREPSRMMPRRSPHAASWPTGLAPTPRSSFR